MNTRTEQLDYDQIQTLWNIAGEPLEGDVLINLLSQGTDDAVVEFFQDAPYELIEWNSYGNLPERLGFCLARAVDSAAEKLAQTPDLPEDLLEEFCGKSDLAVGWYVRTGSRSADGQWLCPPPAGVLIRGWIMEECSECGEQFDSELALYDPAQDSAAKYCSECDEWVSEEDVLSNRASDWEEDPSDDDGRWGYWGVEILTPAGVDGFPAIWEANRDDETTLTALPSDFTVDLRGLPTITREGGVVIRREINPSTTE